MKLVGIGVRARGDRLVVTGMFSDVKAEGVEGEGFGEVLMD